MDRAVPSIIFAAASMSLALRSFIFFSAISFTWAWVTWPTKERPGGFDPEPGFFLVSSLAACFRKNAAGGVLNAKEKDF